MYLTLSGDDIIEETAYGITRPSIRKYPKTTDTVTIAHSGSIEEENYVLDFY